MKLQKAFRDVLRTARKLKIFVFLDLYGGSGGVAWHIHKHGYAALVFDLRLGSHFDLVDPKVNKLILGWITSGCVASVMLVTQCSSWSRARHGPVGSPWGPLRDNSHVYGLPSLSPLDRAKVALGNKQIRYTAAIIAACIKCSVPCILENPISSYIFQAPPIHKLTLHASYHCIHTD